MGNCRTGRGCSKHLQIFHAIREMCALYTPKRNHIQIFQWFATCGNGKAHELELVHGFFNSDMGGAQNCTCRTKFTQNIFICPPLSPAAANAPFLGPTPIIIPSSNSITSHTFTQKWLQWVTPKIAPSRGQSKTCFPGSTRPKWHLYLIGHFIHSSPDRQTHQQMKHGTW